MLVLLDFGLHSKPGVQLLEPGNGSYRLVYELFWLDRVTNISHSQHGVFEVLHAYRNSLR